MDDSDSDAAPVDTDDVLRQLQRLAFVATVGAAVLAGVTWLYTVVVDQNPAWTDTMSGVFTGVTFVGGICMGVLHLAVRMRGARTG